MRKIEIDHKLSSSTPVTDDISDMLAKLASWKPKTLEHVIMACERIIHAANDDIYYKSAKESKVDNVAYFNAMKGKLIKYPNGIDKSTGYLYVTDVKVNDQTWNAEAILTGVRLAKFHRIGNDEIQVYTLSISFNNIIAIEDDGVTIQNHGYNVKYEIVSSYDEYRNAVSRMKTIIDSVQKIPDILTRDMVKISLHKPTKRGKQCQTQPTSTTTGKVVLKSCGALSDTTSSSPETTVNGKERSTKRPPVLAISLRKGSKKSQPSSKTS